VFLDEIDKITSRSETSAPMFRARRAAGPAPPRGGHHRFPPKSECENDHILFIARGRFIFPTSDLIPVAGALPHSRRAGFVWGGFREILTATDACSPASTRRCFARRRSKSLSYRRDRRLAEIAWSVNEKTENIGARRLYTGMRSCWRRFRSMRANAAGRVSGATPIRRCELKDLRRARLARYVL